MQLGLTTSIVGSRAAVRASERDRVLSIARSSLQEYWPLDEPSGTTANDRSGNAHNGAYTGTVTLNAAPIGGGAAAIALAATGNVNLFGAGLTASWNGNECTISGWAKVSAAGDWTDGAARYLIDLLADANNQIYIRKSSTNNTLQFVRVASSTSKVIAVTFSDAGAFHVALTISVASGELRAYLNGVQVGVTQTAIGSYSGTPASGTTVIGASNSGSSLGWKGSIEGIRRDNAALAPIDVARLAHSKGFIVYDGDSRTQGTTSPYPTQAAQVAGLLAKRYGFQNIGVSGQTVLQMSSDAASQIGALYRDYWPTVAVGWGGVNDGHAGFDAATIWSRLQTWAGIVRGLGCKVVLCTEIDDQGAAGNAVNWHSTIWPALNTLIRAGWAAVADGLADLGADSRLQDAANTTYFNADKLHLTDAGYGVVAGLVAAQVSAV